MHRLNPLEVTNSVPGAPPQDVQVSSLSLLEVLWRRRWLLVLATVLSLAAGFAYVKTATPVYRSQARLVIDPNAPRIHSDREGGPLHSENFVQTQVDAFRSTRVLSRALESLDHRAMKTFAGAGGDAVDWIRKRELVSAEPVKRSDVILVSAEALDAAEAAKLVTAIVEAFIIEQAQQRRENGQAMIRALREEKAEVEQRRDTLLQTMTENQHRHGVVSFRDDKGNTVLERNASLSTALANVQLEVVELQARKRAVTDALQEPGKVSAVVASTLLNGRESGDREYDTLRDQLTQAEVALSMSKVVQGADNSQVLAQQAKLDALRLQIADKEWRLAEAYLMGLSTELAAAQERQRQIQGALEAQRTTALSMGSQATEHERLLTEVDRLQRQAEALEGRMVEVSVNNLKEGPLNVRVVEPARVERTPVKPQKKLILLGALLVGWVAGLGLVMAREWQDARLHNPAEIVTLLGAPVLGMVPRINAKLSPVTRGQVVLLDTRSPVAEAYRALRASLHHGGLRNAKTIVVASPNAGDGKSTTASNLAIAFAQAGERTVVIDCDLRQPVQHLIFETHGQVGLCDVLAGGTKLADALRPTRIAKLHVLPCGPIPADPAQHLAGQRFARVMQALTSNFDRVIIDSPPVTMVADGHILSASADATLLVLRMDRSVRHVVAHAREALERVGANVVGAVANDVPASAAYRYYYGAYDRGSWHYAQHVNRLLTVEAAGAAAPHDRDVPTPDTSRAAQASPPPATPAGSADHHH